MVINKRLLVYASALIIMSSFLIVGASEILQTPMVKPKKLYAINVTKDYEDTTTSITYVPVPNTTISFTTGKAKGSLVITFSTEAKVTEGDGIHTRANVSTPTSWSYALGPEWFATNTKYETRTVVWIFKEVEPYTTYTVTVVWRVTGGTGRFYWRTLTVLWNKKTMT
jgi:hypothetical protein